MTPEVARSIVGNDPPLLVIRPDVPLTDVTGDVPVEAEVILPYESTDIVA